MGAIDSKRLTVLRSALIPLQDRLSLPQLVTLIAVGAEPGISVGELAERTRSPQQSASRHAAVLLGRYSDPTAAQFQTPLLKQEIHPADPRKRALYLTEKGRDLLQALLEQLFLATATEGEN